MIDIEQMRRDIRREATRFAIVAVAGAAVLFGVGVGIGWSGIL